MTLRNPGTSALLATLLALPVALRPALATAADGEPPGAMKYGFKGFFTGAPIGLADLEGHAPAGVELELHEGGQPHYWWLLAAQ